MMMWILLLAGFIFAEEESPFVDLPYYLQQIRYDQCDEFRGTKQIKIAVLENSFSEFSEEDLKILPEDFELVLPENNIPSAGLDPKSLHGKYVAQLIYLITTRGGNRDNPGATCPELAPKLYLIPAGSYTKLNQAIDKAVTLKVDFILHTNVHPYYGFGDGKGFLNGLVNKAVDAGITWVNAAGNFQEKIYQDRIRTSESGRVQISTEDKDFIRIECLKTPENEECDATIVLQWNDYREDPYEVSPKKLDFSIYDLKDKKLAEKEIKLEHVTSARYPYKAARLTLQPGDYRIRIDNVSKNFEANDQFRLIVDSEYIKLKSINRSANYILPPADNPRVITIGATDSELSSKFSGKPNYVLPSSLRDPKYKMSDDSKGEYVGSSISAAIYVSLAAMVKARFPDDKQTAIEAKVKERFIDSKHCHFTVNVLSEDKEYLRTVLGVELDSVVFYPHEHGIRYLTSQPPHKFFGLHDMRPTHFIGIMKTVDENGKVTANIANMPEAGYISFIALDGIVVKQISEHYICKQ